MQVSFEGNTKTVFWQIILALVFLVLLPFFISDYYVYLAALILVRALFATSLNLVVGYGGMLHLHPAVFFGLGAYSVALIITKTSLPFWVGFVLGPIAAALVAAAIGWFCVRLEGLYFGMLTLALGQLVWSVVYRWYEVTGGDDGIHGIDLPTWLKSTSGSYFAIVIVGTVCFYIFYKMVNSPFGVALQATRDNPQRSESIGIDLKRHRLTAFIISGFFAGIAGTLFVMVERSVSPNLLYWTLSAEVLIMCLVGGMHKFWGPAVGAVTLVLLRSFIGSQANYWLALLGVILLLVVLFIPQGVLGYLSERLPFRPFKSKVGEKHAQC